MRRRIGLAALAAGLLVGLSLALRLVVATRWPVWFPGDSSLYRGLALSLRLHQRFALGPPPAPLTWGRPPGYPLFLLLVGGVDRLGQPHPERVAVAQAVLDTLTVVLAALSVASIARRAALVPALLLGLLLPLELGWIRWELTEILASFLLVASTLCALQAPSAERPGRWIFASSLLAGGGTLVRPELFLGLIVPAGVVALRWPKDGRRTRLLLATATVAGFLSPTLPWIARNQLELGVTAIAARYPDVRARPAEIQDYAWWCRTWTRDIDDVTHSIWPVLGLGPLRIEALPARAFDTPAERTAVAAIYDAYNRRHAEGSFSPIEEKTFAELAWRRTLAHPARTLLAVPLAGIADTWLRHRPELMKLPARAAGDLEPIESFSCRLVFLAAPLALLVLLGLALGRGGDDRPRAALGLVVFASVVARIALLAWLANPDPRYATPGESLLFLCDVAAFALFFHGIGQRRRQKRTSAASPASTGRS